MAVSGAVPSNSALRVKYLDILRGGKEGLQQAVNENVNKEEQAHILKANRYKASFVKS